MSNRIWVVLFSIISIASLAVATWSIQGMRANARGQTVRDDSAMGPDAQRRIEAKLTAISARLAALERQPASGSAISGASLADVDTNIETLAKAASKNTQDVQLLAQQVENLNRQIQSLIQSSQDAFTVVSGQIQEIRGDPAKPPDRSGAKYVEPPRASP
jgi:type IV secretory pathway VirJ component